MPYVFKEYNSGRVGFLLLKKRVSCATTTVVQQQQLVFIKHQIQKSLPGIILLSPSA